MNRRTFIDFLLGGAAAGTFISILYPVVRYLLPPPLKEEEVEKVVAARVGELTPNSAKVFRFGSI
ncbi:MAG: cytochrome B6, partial [Candidatus Aminicenantes bacterium]|nr:cytochrome B6 [Candidatus Aminicenantes bacterium]